MASSPQGYDEDISVNPFFLFLRRQHRQFYEVAAESRWIVCVPRAGSFRPIAFQSLDDEDVAAYVLIPQDEAGVHHKTLDGRRVRLGGGRVRVVSGFAENEDDDCEAIDVLFEETFFNAKDESYRVLCLERPFDSLGFDGSDDAVKNVISDSAKNGVDAASRSADDDDAMGVDECARVIWGHASGAKLRHSLEALVRKFNKMDEPLNKVLTAEQIVDRVHTVYKDALSLVVYSKRKHRASLGGTDVARIQVALETYILHHVWANLWTHLSANFCIEDAELNKTTKNLSWMSLQDLGVRSEFHSNLPRARQILSNINQVRTPRGKARILRKTVEVLSRTPPRRSLDAGGAPTPNSDYGPELVLTSDDLLPLICFLVIRVESVPNWRTNLFYLQRLRFASSKIDRDAFLLTSFEAALQHLHQLRPEVPFCKLSLDGELSGQSTDVRDGIHRLYKSIAEGDAERVARTLLNTAALENNAGEEGGESHRPLCHPLCRCVSCRDVVDASLRRSSVLDGVTLLVKDDRGFTPLHVAALFGRTSVTERLVDAGALVNVADHYGRTPLHLAASRGETKTALMLLHSKADPNLRDCDGFTALHACVAGGHGVCAKALLYYDQGYLLDVNSTTNTGDTALHFASRLGYVDLVEVLLEHGAGVELRNRRNETAFDCAHSAVVGRRLAAALQQRVEETKRRKLAQTSTPPSASSKDGVLRSKSMPERLSPEISKNDNDSKDVAGDDSISTPPTKPRKLPSSRSFTASSDSDAYFRKVERLFRAIADGDEHLVRHLMGWDSEDGAEESSDSVSSSPPPSSYHKDSQLCHPLCDCRYCRPLQRRQASARRSGLTVDSSNREGITPLHIAALYNSLTLAKLFVKRGGTVDARTKTQLWTPLHLGCQRNSVHVLDMLLTHGADASAADVRGNTPLHYAALNGFLASSEILVTVGGADVNAVNLKGNAPLHVLAGRGRGGISADKAAAPGGADDVIGIAKLLLEKGADSLKRNRNGLSAAELAANPAVRETLERLKKTKCEGRSDGGESEPKVPVRDSKHDVFEPTVTIVDDDRTIDVEDDSTPTRSDDAVDDRIIGEIANAMETLVV